MLRNRIVRMSLFANGHITKGVQGRSETTKQGSSPPHI